MFYLLSKDLKQPLFDDEEIGQKQSVEGWKYFGTLSDASGGMNLAQFQVQMQKTIARFIEQYQVEDMLASFIKTNLSITSVPDIDVQITRTTKRLVAKILESTPVFAMAIFRLFGQLPPTPIPLSPLVICVPASLAD